MVQHSIDSRLLGVALVHEFLCDGAQVDVCVRRGSDQEGESAVFVHVKTRERFKDLPATSPSARRRGINDFAQLRGGQRWQEALNAALVDNRGNPVRRMPRTRG